MYKRSFNFRILPSNIDPADGLSFIKTEDDGGQTYDRLHIVEKWLNKVNVRLVMGPGASLQSVSLHQDRFVAQLNVKSISLQVTTCSGWKVKWKSQHKLFPSWNNRIICSSNHLIVWSLNSQFPAAQVKVLIFPLLSNKKSKIWKMFWGYFRLLRYMLWKISRYYFCGHIVQSNNQSVCHSGSSASIRST